MDANEIFGAESLVKSDPSRFTKLVETLRTDVKFRNTFFQNRPDLKNASLKTYDLILAGMMLKHNFSDEEIKEYLIAFRKDSDEALETGADAYYAAVIKNVKIERSCRLAEEILKEISLTDDRNERRVATIKYLREIFKVPITRILMYRTDPPQFRLETEVGNVFLGPIGDVVSQVAMRKSILLATKVWFQSFTKKQWDVIVQAMIDACIEEEMDMESTEAGLIISLLRQYLESKPPSSNVEEAAASKYPYTDFDSDVRIFSADFKKWATFSSGERLAGSKISVLLKTVGCIYERPHFEANGGTRTSCSVWKVPKSLYTQGADVDDE